MSGPTSSDEQRFTEIFEACHDAVLAYVRRRISADVAQDVVAETFLAAWRNLDDIPSTSLPWLYRAASFEIGHARRRRAQDRRLGTPLTTGTAVAPDPADEITLADNWAIAFRQLDEGDKEVLRLVAWEGVTPAEGAFIFECSLPAFKVRLHRARRRLVRLLEEAEGRTTVPLGRPVSDSPSLCIRADRAALFVELARPAIQKECP